MRRLLAAAVLLAALGPATAAGAHGDEGELEVVNTVPQGDGSAVTFTVELTYADDGDLVDGAVVTAIVRGPGGAQPPVDLVGAGEGWYAGTIRFPGAGQWRVTFATADPEATVEATHRVSEPAPSTTTTAPPAATAPPATVDDAQLVADEGADDGPPTGMVIGVVVAVALLVGAVVVLVVRRRPA